MKIKNFLLVSSACLVISGCSQASQQEREENCQAMARLAAATWALKAHFMHDLRRYDRGLVTGPGDKRVEHKRHIEYTSLREMERHHLALIKSDLTFNEKLNPIHKKVFDLIYQNENLDRWYSEKQVIQDFKESCMEGHI